jgi:hypothetical protein
LKACNEPNDQAIHRCLEGRGQEFIERGAIESALNKLMEGERLNRRREDTGLMNYGSYVLG